MAFAEHDRVVVTRDLPDVGLQAGDLGVIVYIHAAGQAYELEVFSATGETLAVETVPGDAVRPRVYEDTLHVRTWAAE